jgi:hypothetical protein
LGTGVGLGRDREPLAEQLRDLGAVLLVAFRYQQRLVGDDGVRAERVRDRTPEPTLAVRAVAPMDAEGLGRVPGRGRARLELQVRAHLRVGLPRLEAPFPKLGAGIRVVVDRDELRAQIGRVMVT